MSLCNCNLAWRKMDNYWAHFLDQNPSLDPLWKERIQHFRSQYLMKMSNICPQEVLQFQQNISPWSSPSRGDYHRLYHQNRLLEAIEAELALRGPRGEERFFVLGKRDRFVELLAEVRQKNCHWQTLLQGFQERFLQIEGIDVLVVPASQQEIIESWMGEWGLTPSLQETCRLASTLSLDEPHSVYDFPAQAGSVVSIQAFFEHPIYQEFREKRGDLFQAKVCLSLLEGFRGKEKIGSLFSDSYGRILHALQAATFLDLSQYGNWALLEKEMDLIYEEMTLWAMLTEPYPEGVLEKAIETCILKPAYLQACSSGMAAFAEILKTALSEDSVLLVFEGGYYENRSVLLKSYKEENLYLVRAPEYAASLKKNVESLRRQKRKVDVLLINLHENMLKGRLFCEENPVSLFLQEVLDAGCAADCLTVILDTTIGYLNDPKIQELLDRFRKKGVQFFLFWSHQKFDLLGVDKFSGGTLCYYGDDQDLISRLKSNRSDTIDFVSRQMLTHFFVHASSFLEERRKQIFANASFVYQRIDKRLLFDPQKTTQPICVVEKRDPQNFSIDVQCDQDRELQICEAFHQRGIPVLTRSGFGFNLTSVAFTRFHMARFSIGLEDRALLVQFVQAFNEIFLSFC